MIKRKQNRDSIVEALTKVQEIIFAPLTFQGIASLLDFGILALLDKKELSINEIIQQLKLDEYTVKTLLQIGEVSNIVQLDSDKYSLTLKGKMFLYDEMTIANFNFIKDVCYLGASELTQSLKDKEPRGLQKYVRKTDTIYPILSSLPEKMKQSWYNFDHLYSDNSFEQVLEIIKQRYNHIFDIGGNTGKFERLCLKNNCDIIMLDLEENVTIVKNNKELKGCKFYPIDVLKEPAKYPEIKNSAVLMSQFLDCFSKEQIVKILTDIKNNMSTDSSIYILEPFTDNQEFDAAKFSLTHISLYFTCMANGKSKMYEQTEFLDLIKETGLKLQNIYNNIGPYCYTLLECSK